MISPMVCLLCTNWFSDSVALLFFGSSGQEDDSFIEKNCWKKQHGRSRMFHGNTVFVFLFKS